MNEFDDPEGVLIARTEPKERMEVDNGQRWYEYRLRPVTEKETYELRQSGAIGKFDAPRFILEHKHHATHNSMMFTEGWLVWTYGDSPDAAIEDVIGDTGFQEANSIHPIHSFHVQHHRKVRAANSLLYESEKAWQAAVEERDHFKFEVNQEYVNKTYGKPEERQKKVKERLHAKYDTRMKELNELVIATHSRFLAAEQEAKRLNAIKPRYASP
jgi:hypothetical protein